MLPFIIFGLIAAGSTIVGAASHVSAKSTIKKANRLIERSQEKLEDTEQRFAENVDRTKNQLVEFGTHKKNILDTSMSIFINLYKKVKDVELKNSPGMEELSLYAVDSYDVQKIEYCRDSFDQQFKSAVAGGTTGLVLLGLSGLAMESGAIGAATAAISASGISAAGLSSAGLAATALPVGIVCAAIAAPAVLFTGISASNKADEHKEEAEIFAKKVDGHCEVLEGKIVLCQGIVARAELFSATIMELNKTFVVCNAMLAYSFRKKRSLTNPFGRVTKNNLTEQEKDLLAMCRALAGAIKSIIDTPMLINDMEERYKQEVNRAQQQLGGRLNQQAQEHIMNNIKREMETSGQVNESHINPDFDQTLENMNVCIPKFKNRLSNMIALDYGPKAVTPEESMKYYKKLKNIRPKSTSYNSGPSWSERSFADKIWSVVPAFFAITGTIGRISALIRTLLIFIGMMVSIGMLGSQNPVSMGLFIVGCYSFFCINSKRLHDMGRSCLWGFLMLIPYLNILYFLWIVVWPPKKVNNPYKM